jgi:hypothetical protein
MTPEIKDELKRLAAENGGELRARDVVDAARENSSPLHTQFEWDDSLAAERYRIAQARALIRVTVEYAGKPPIKTRVFVSLTSDRRRDGVGYRLTTDVMNSADQQRQLLRDALEEMQRFQIKFRQLRQLADVFAAMREAAAGVAKDEGADEYVESPEVHAGAPLGG